MAVNPVIPEGFILEQPGLPEGFIVEQEDAAIEEPPKQKINLAEMLQPPIGLAMAPFVAADAANAMMGEAGGQVAGGLTGVASTPFGVDTAVRNIEAMQGAFQRPPQFPIVQQGLQQLAGLVEQGVDLLRIPFGATAEFIELLTGAEPEDAKKVQQDIIERGFQDTYADSVYEQTQSPLAGTIAKVAPALIPELLAIATGGYAFKPKTPRIRAADEPGASAEPSVAEYEEITKGLAGRQVEPSVEDAMPDAQIMADAEELGIDLNPDHYSSNLAFRQVVQSLKSRPGSPLPAIEQKAIADLGERADELITDLGGQADKTILDANISGQFETTIKELEKQADKAYKAIDEVIPRRAQIEATESRKYIEDALADVGGDKKLLTKAEKKLLALLDGNPTYAALDRIRKDVGNGFKGRGPFKDADSGVLSQVYKALSIDQQNAAIAFSPEIGATYRSAKELVAKRKAVEEQMIAAFGREVNKSLIPGLTSAATALTKGDVSKFNKLIKSLPENRRQEAVATMLNDLFSMGTRAKGDISGGFLNAYQALNRNKGAKDLIFQHLPEGARTKFDRIGRIATGIYRSKALENKSKTAADVIAAIEDGGLFNRLLDIGEKLTPLPGTGTSMVGAASGIINKTSTSDIATEFITSPKFKQALETSAKTGDIRDADRILKGNLRYERWKKQLSQQQLAQLTSLGFIAYITGEE